MKHLLICYCVGVAYLHICTLAKAAPPVVNHAPFGSGAFADTDYFDPFAEIQRSSLVADDFELHSNASIANIRWWGYYVEDNPPPLEEFRIRVYEHNIDTGLPDGLIFDDTFSSANRTATGRTYLIIDLSREFEFDLELDLPIVLEQTSKYWLEVTQIGDGGSAFIWEHSLADRNGFAFQDTFFPNWTFADIPADAAFQLYAIPEPATLTMLAAGVALMARRLRRDRPAV